MGRERETRTFTGCAVVVVPLPTGDGVVVKTTVVIAPEVSFTGVGVVSTNVVVPMKVSVLVFAGSAVVVIKVSVLVFAGSAVVVSSCAILTVIMVMQMLIKSMACGLSRALESLNITIPELAFGPTDKTGKKKRELPYLLTCHPALLSLCRALFVGDVLFLF
jgi:hypothetical protein